MKLTKKKVFVAALAICLIAILSMGSLAWFSGSDEVTNKFMIATSDDTDPDDIFSVDVWENVDPDGDGVDEEVGKGPDDGEITTTYPDILPGDTLGKEAHVENTGYYDQYIRVIITISDAKNWKKILADDETPNKTMFDCFDGFDRTQWNHISTKVLKDTDEIRIVMYYKGVLDGRDTTNDAISGTTSDITVFKNVKIPTVMDQADAAGFGGDGFSIVVKAEAVQTENVGGDAYTAFETVGMTID